MNEIWLLGTLWLSSFLFRLLLLFLNEHNQQRPGVAVSLLSTEHVGSTCQAKSALRLTSRAAVILGWGCLRAPWDSSRPLR